MRKFLLAMLLFSAEVAIGTTSQLGRNPDISWPDLGDPAGASQVNTIQGSVTVLSDDSNGRYQEFSGIADSASNTITHSLGVALAELNVLIYTGSGTALTRVTTVGDAGSYQVAAGGTPKTQIDVTAPTSGGPHTFAVVIIHNPQDLEMFNAGSPLTTKGDVLGTDGTDHVRFAACTDGQSLGYLAAGTGGFQCISPLSNPMTTQGDTIYSSDGSGTPARLAIGGSDTVLVGGGSIPAYSATPTVTTLDATTDVTTDALKADTITDEAGTGDPNFSQGLHIAGNSADVIDVYLEENKTADNEFTGGTVRFRRIGSMVTISANVLTHSSSSSRATSAGFVPTDYRPATDSENVWSAVSTRIRKVMVTSGGTLSIEYFDWAGGTADTTDTGNALTISYNK